MQTTKPSAKSVHQSIKITFHNSHAPHKEFHYLQITLVCLDSPVYPSPSETLRAAVWQTVCVGHWCPAACWRHCVEESRLWRACSSPCLPPDPHNSHGTQHGTYRLLQSPPPGTEARYVLERQLEVMFITCWFLPITLKQDKSLCIYHTHELFPLSLTPHSEHRRRWST